MPRKRSSDKKLKSVKGTKKDKRSKVVKKKEAKRRTSTVPPGYLWYTKCTPSISWCENKKSRRKRKKLISRSRKPLNKDRSTSKSTSSKFSKSVKDIFQSSSPECDKTPDISLTPEHLPLIKFQNENDNCENLTPVLTDKTKLDQHFESPKFEPETDEDEDDEDNGDDIYTDFELKQKKKVLTIFDSSPVLTNELLLNKEPDERFIKNEVIKLDALWSLNASNDNSSLYDGVDSTNELPNKSLEKEIIDESFIKKEIKEEFLCPDIKSEKLCNEINFENLNIDETSTAPITPKVLPKLVEYTSNWEGDDEDDDDDNDDNDDDDDDDDDAADEDIDNTFLDDELQSVSESSTQIHQTEKSCAEEVDTETVLNNEYEAFMQILNESNHRSRSRSVSVSSNTSSSSSSSSSSSNSSTSSSSTTSSSSSSSDSSTSTTSDTTSPEQVELSENDLMLNRALEKIMEIIPDNFESIKGEKSLNQQKLTAEILKILESDVIKNQTEASKCNTEEPKKEVNEDVQTAVKIPIFEMIPRTRTKPKSWIYNISQHGDLQSTPQKSPTKVMKPSSKENTSTDHNSSSRVSKSSPHESKSSTRERKSSPRESKSSTRERKSSPRESKSSTRERKSSPREIKSSSREIKSSTRDSKSLPRESKSSPHEAKLPPRESISPRESKTSPHESKSLPRESKSPPRESISPRESKSSPRESKSSPRDSKSLPRESKSPPREGISPRESKSSTRERKSSPREIKSSPLESKTSPRESKSLPRENKSPPRESIISPRESKSSPHKSTSLPRESKPSSSTSSNRYHKKSSRSHDEKFHKSRHSREKTKDGYDNHRNRSDRKSSKSPINDSRRNKSPPKRKSSSSSSQKSGREYIKNIDRELHRHHRSQPKSPPLHESHREWSSYHDEKNISTSYTHYRHPSPKEQFHYNPDISPSSSWNSAPVNMATDMPMASQFKQQYIIPNEEMYRNNVNNLVQNPVMSHHISLDKRIEVALSGNVMSDQGSPMMVPLVSQPPSRQPPPSAMPYYHNFQNYQNQTDFNPPMEYDDYFTSFGTVPPYPPPPITSYNHYIEPIMNSSIKHYSKPTPPPNKNKSLFAVQVGNVLEIIPSVIPRSSRKLKLSSETLAKTTIIVPPPVEKNIEKLSIPTENNRKLSRQEKQLNKKARKEKMKIEIERLINCLNTNFEITSLAEDKDSELEKPTETKYVTNRISNNIDIVPVVVTKSDKGILRNSTLDKLKTLLPKKKVMFNDGVEPGNGTSTSEDDEMTLIYKAKKKKRKIKSLSNKETANTAVDKIDGLSTSEIKFKQEQEEYEFNLPPPPPPPGSPPATSIQPTLKNPPPPEYLYFHLNPAENRLIVTPYCPTLLHRSLPPSALHLIQTMPPPSPQQLSSSHILQPVPPPPQTVSQKSSNIANCQDPRFVRNRTLEGVR